jgi:hypothetical protein
MQSEVDLMGATGHGWLHGLCDLAWFAGLRDGGCGSDALLRFSLLIPLDVPALVLRG